MSAYQEIERALIARLRGHLAAVPPAERAAWLGAYLGALGADANRQAVLSGACADMNVVLPANTGAGQAAAPGASGAPGASPLVLSKWEDYEAAPGGWSLLEQLCNEQPEVYLRLYADYQARSIPPRVLARHVAAHGAPVTPPLVLSKWEDYDATPGGWHELERLGHEQPEAFQRLYADYRSRSALAKGPAAEPPGPGFTRQVP